jgi:hypothetical protein
MTQEAKSFFCPPLVCRTPNSLLECFQSHKLGSNRSHQLNVLLRQGGCISSASSSCPTQLPSISLPPFLFRVSIILVMARPIARISHYPQIPYPLQWLPPIHLIPARESRQRDGFLVRRGRQSYWFENVGNADITVKQGMVIFTAPRRPLKCVGKGIVSRRVRLRQRLTRSMGSAKRG